MRLALVVLLAILASACAALPRQTSPTPKPEHVHLRHVDLKMHADADFSDIDQAFILQAAFKWTAFTKGRVRITVVFDIDYASAENLFWHRHERHSLIIGANSASAIAKSIDKTFDADENVIPMAATIRDGNAPALVVLILDRISTARFEAVVVHELGHVLGLPDLPAYGYVMSGVSSAGSPTPEWFTEADEVLCRAAYLCD